MLCLTHVTKSASWPAARVELSCSRLCEESEEEEEEEEMDLKWPPNGHQMGGNRANCPQMVTECASNGHQREDERRAVTRLLTPKMRLSATELNSEYPAICLGPKTNCALAKYRTSVDLNDPGILNKPQMRLHD